MLTRVRYFVSHSSPPTNYQRWKIQSRDLIAIVGEQVWSQAERQTVRTQTYEGLLETFTRTILWTEQERSRLRLAASEDPDGRSNDLKPTAQIDRHATIKVLTDKLVTWTGATWANSRVMREAHLFNRGDVACQLHWWTCHWGIASVVQSRLRRMETIFYLRGDFF